MNPVDFPGSNRIYAKDQPEYAPLPAFVDANGVAVTCWRATWRERFRIFFTGRVWAGQLTFNNPLQPQFLAAVNPIEYPPPVKS